MKVAEIKSDQPFKVSNNTSYGIQNYGSDNDFPQRVMEIVGASGTGSSCLDVYRKFVYGRGFADTRLYDMLVNEERETADTILRLISGDLSQFYGFALHVNYNLRYEKSSIHFVPFEHCRFEKMDKETRSFKKIAVYWDWAKQYVNLVPFRKSNIDFIDLYDPDPEKIQQQVDEAGGWKNYKGQILYFSGAGPLTYPSPKYVAELTDMRTEEALANITGRNACSNFFLSGLLIEYATQEQDDNQLSELQKQILGFQGDTVSGNILCAQVDNKDEKPEFVPFSGQNYDKAFTATQAAVPDNIGRVFMQPPILRAKDVGANFGADLMKQAYNFYNSVTADERLILERVFTDVFANWHEPLSDYSFTVQALTYNAGDTLLDRLGKENTDKIVTLLTDTTLDADRVRNILEMVYGLSEEEINKLLTGQENVNTHG